MIDIFMFLSTVFTLDNLVIMNIVTLNIALQNYQPQMSSK